MPFLISSNTLVKDSISYIDVSDGTRVAMQDSLHLDFYRLRQVSMGDTASLSKDGLPYYYTSKGDSTNNKGHEGSLLPFALEQTDGVFGLLLLCFLFFAHLYNGGFNFLKENIRLIFSSEKSYRVHRQTTVKEIFYSYFLIFQAIVLVSICLYDVFMEYSPLGRESQTPFITIASFIVLISLFLQLKIHLYKFMGYVFDAKSLALSWIRTYIVVFELLGILFFLPTLVLIYSEYWHFFVIGFMLILFLISQIILFYRIIIYFISEKFNFLYLIAYLCTIEILPYVFLALGLVYLYRFDVLNVLWLLK
ncbi:DUF4271 domain-containing protein [Dysgonomonas sp. ZJ709]|uniref:DUF4271 domain-containing protein n=1 Tax=Dysgonomonas sp. ZJ709 TaxID=2709797 RepID=UPI0021036C27|nr:DUF4271 domain-containing protein [Dysgonomonas sp. ZJ709]